jgi:hypothetical protein
MSSTSRLAKSFTIEPEINDYVLNTKGNQSASTRVNELLKRAILAEQYDRVEPEAAAFFADGDNDPAATKALQRAAIRTLGRD